MTALRTEVGQAGATAEAEGMAVIQEIVQEQVAKRDRETLRIARNARFAAWVAAIASVLAPIIATSKDC